MTAKITPSRNFGSHFLGGEKRHVVTVTNNGGAPATAVAISGIDDPYTQDGTCPATLAPKASCSFNIDFRPTADGKYNDEIVIDYNNGKDKRDFKFPIVGTGKSKPAVLTVDCQHNSVSYTHLTLPTIPLV